MNRWRLYLLSAFLAVPFIRMLPSTKTDPWGECGDSWIVNTARADDPVPCCGQQFVLAQAPKDKGKEIPNPKTNKHTRGYKLPPLEVRMARHKMSAMVHGKKLAKLPKATEPAYDAVALGYVNDMEDQDGCGDCFLWSGTDVCANAFRRAGTPLPGNGQLSVQWSLDNQPNFGGCGGGDEWEVTQFILQHGVPCLKDYPGAGTSPGNPQPFTGTYYKIVSMGFCDPNAGADSTASTQSIKDAIKAYGSVSTAIAAGSWGDPGSSVMVGGNDGIDHAVQIVGWDDSKGNGGAWKMRNQWGTSWGFGGYAWVQYGSYGIGTECYFVTVAAPPPPPPAFKAPFTLYEGTMAAPIQVGVVAGYPDVPTAEAAGKTIANKDNAAVMVHDSTGAMVEIIQPTPPPGQTVTVTIPAQNIVIPGQTVGAGFRRITIPAQNVTIPAQTVTGTITTGKERMHP